jgi:hypothetical protein
LIIILVGVESGLILFMIMTPGIIFESLPSSSFSSSHSVQDKVGNVSKILNNPGSGNDYVKFSSFYQNMLKKLLLLLLLLLMYLFVYYLFCIRFYSGLLLRLRFPVLREGNVLFLDCKHRDGTHSEVLLLLLFLLLLYFACYLYVKIFNIYKKVFCVARHGKNLIPMKLGNVDDNEKWKDKNKDKNKDIEKYGNLDSHIVLCICSTIKDRCYAYIDFSGLRNLLVYGKYERCKKENINAEEEKRAEDEMNNKVIFQIRDITNHFSLSHLSYYESEKIKNTSQNTSSVSVYSSNVDMHPHFLFLSELLHSPLYYTIGATTSRVLVLTAHPRIFPLEVFNIYLI